MHKVLNVLVVDVNYSAETQQMQKWSLPFPTLNLANQFSSMKKSNSLIIPGWFQFERRDNRASLVLVCPAAHYWDQNTLCIKLLQHFYATDHSIHLQANPFSCSSCIHELKTVIFEQQVSGKKVASMGKRFFTKILHLANRKLLMQLVLASYSRHLLPNVMTFKKTSQWQIYTRGLCFLGGLL